MAKRNLLAGNMKRPSLKREMKVTEEGIEQAVQKVADNPPPPQPTKTKPAVGERSSKKKATAAEKNVPAQKTKKVRGRPRSAAPNPSTTETSVYPVQGTKRLTLDIPQDLHKRLKLLSIHQEISMKDYIIDIVQRSLK